MVVFQERYAFMLSVSSVSLMLTAQGLHEPSTTAFAPTSQDRPPVS